VLTQIDLEVTLGQLERLGSRAADTGAHPDVYLDTASYGARALQLCIDALGVRQLVYGSDIPVIDSRPTLRAVQGLAVEEALCRENPARLLSRA
jgi:predicted TIM-barrel fold metal-dependent hydrolase